MKTYIFSKVLLMVLLFGISFSAFAQVPQGIPYQAVARNSSGNILASQTIRVRFSIRDSVATGSIVYRETFTPTTNALGLFSVNVGTGTVVTGAFSGINWGTNAKFMQVEMDPTGGTTYTDMGTTQMMSVPYSLYSGSSLTSSNCFTHYVGEAWGGGVVFHVYRGGDGNEHGLIVTLTDQSTFRQWSIITSTLIGSSAQSSWDGLANSNAMFAQLVEMGGYYSAARECLELVSGGYNDWYLPSRLELNLLFQAQYNVNRTLSTLSGATQLVQTAYYWSSTEYASNIAALIGFRDGMPSNGFKGNSYYVRAIRSF